MRSALASSTRTEWADRQITSGRDVELSGRMVPCPWSGATGVDAETGALVVEAEPRRVAAPCSSGRSGTCGSLGLQPPRPGQGCNAMARPALRRVARPEETVRPRLARLDRDRSLVDAARNDPARFDALYRKYLAQVYNFAVYELGDHHEAEDATERTFLSALAGLTGFEERARPEDGPEASTFRIWLFQIARNVVAERRRGRRRRPEAPLEIASEAPDPADLEETVVRRELATAAWGAVDRLTGDRRRAVVLRFVHEMTTAEIASILGRSEGAVRVLIHRGLRRVAGELRAPDRDPR